MKITQLPDLVAVIRCKDCAYYKKPRGEAWHCTNKTNGLVMPEKSDFCSYAKRRTEHAANL